MAESRRFACPGTSDVATARLQTAAAPEPADDHPRHRIDRDDDGVTLRLPVGAPSVDVLTGLIYALAGRQTLRLLEVARDREGYLIRFTEDPPEDQGDAPTL